MSIGRKVFVAFFAAGVAVAEIGALSIYSFWMLRNSISDPVISEKLMQAAEWLIWATPVATGLVVGIGMVMARSIDSRIESFSILQGKPIDLPAAIASDEPDTLSTAYGNLANCNKSLHARKSMKDPAAEAKRYADNIINSMFDALIVTDPELKIVSVNRAACELLEYSEVQLVGRSIVDMFRPEPYGLCPSAEIQLRNSTTRDNEMTYQTATGQHVSALVSASTMRDAAGRPIGIITVGKDISARKRIEIDLLDAKRAAEAASRAKSLFLANMSHEIRTPMTAILGYADLLTAPELEEAERHQCVETIRRNGQHLLQIINDVLDVSKIEAGRMSVERIACAPRQIVEDVAALMAVRSADKGLSFDVRYAGPIPQTIQSDPTRLRQVLMNLIGNAIKFTSEGGVSLAVYLEPADKGRSRSMRFEVSDTGIGLTEAQQESLFQPFVQADATTTRKFGGTGLGLAISKRLAEMLGGDIAVRSQPNRGSTFSLTIETGDLAGVPMMESPRSHVMASSPASTRRWNQTLRLSGRVLVAEDGHDNRVLISYHLRNAGLDVTVVENGVLARDQAMQAKLNHLPFDLILTDMQMPELDGYGMAQELRAAGYRGPIVALTAHAMEGDREKCISAGCDDVVLKPIELETFMATVRRYVKDAVEESSDNGPTSPEQRQPRRTKLLDRFVGGLDQRAEAIRTALVEADRARLHTLAHQLKGAAGGYGFPALSQAAGQVEASIEKDIAEMQHAVDDLILLCKQVKQAAAPQDQGNSLSVNVLK
jgi:PAS domain S-box-containing protein